MTYTTIDIDNLRRVKRKALDSGITLRELVNRSIGMYLSGRAVEIENPRRVKAEATKKNMTPEELVNRAIVEYLKKPRRKVGC